MQYGQKDIDTEACADYMGTKFALSDLNMSPISGPAGVQGAIEQRDASLLYYHTKYMSAPKEQKAEALARYNEQLESRMRIDNAMTSIAATVGHELNELMERTEQVNDWDCYKQSVAGYTEECGNLGQYGMKYGKAIVNMCNAGVASQEFVLAAEKACH